MLIPATAIGNKPTGVSTEKRPPTCGNNECLIAFLVSQRAESASFGVCDGDDTVFGFFFADCVFQLLFQHAHYKNCEIYAILAVFIYLYINYLVALCDRFIGADFAIGRNRKPKLYYCLTHISYHMKNYFIT